MQEEHCKFFYRKPHIAREMLNEFWVDLKLKGEDSNRSLNTILRIADAHAGLALKEVIDVEIAENDEGGLYF